MELTTGKLETEPSPIQGTIKHIYREKTRSLIYTGRKAITTLYREKSSTHLYREKSKRPLIQRKASIPIEWKK